MTTPLPSFDLEEVLPQYFINESGLKVNVETGDLLKEDNDSNDLYYGYYGA